MKFSNTLFGRIFRLFMAIMVFNFTILIAVLAWFVLSPGGRHYGYLSKTVGVLAGEVAQQSDGASKRRLAERLKRGAGVTMAWDAEERGSAPPRRPFFMAWQRALKENPKDALVIRYQREPDGMLWLQHQAQPEFSLGFPAENLLGMPFFMLLDLSIALVLSMSAAFWAARRLSRPLQTLAEAAGRLGRELRCVEIHPDGPEEIRAVGQALNTLHRNLDHLIKEQEFLLAGISHDLRTPLARLRLSAEMLGADSDGLGEGMKEDIEEMNLILQRFIELTRFNIEETEPWKVGDITPLLRDVAQKYRRADTGLELCLDEIPPVRYKPLAFRRLLYNLIDNGIKHGGGLITLIAEAGRDRVDVCVADRGPGLPPAMGDLETGPNLWLKEGRGGLGLHIVRRIAELHDAELKFGNGPHGGAEIVLSLKPYDGPP
jgi:two-component system osmolarity sensor histidine kinase EnvZ